MVNYFGECSDLHDLDPDYDDERQWLKTPVHKLTCHQCEDRSTCPYAYDYYNTNDNCLAAK